MRNFVLSTLAALVFCAGLVVGSNFAFAQQPKLAAAPATSPEKKKITVDLLPTATHADCLKSWQYDAEVSGDKLLVSIGAYDVTLRADSLGSIKEYRSPTGTRFRFTSNFKERRLRVDSLWGGYPYCSYEGSF